MSLFYLCKHVKVSNNCEYESAAISLYKKVYIKRCFQITCVNQAETLLNIRQELNVKMHATLAPSLACSCLYIVQVVVCRFTVNFRKQLQEPWEKVTECSLELLLPHMDSLVCPCLNMGETGVQPS